MVSRARWQRSTGAFAASNDEPLFVKRHRLQSSIARARLLGGLVVLLALPGKPAFAASLVYIKDGNVWIATPDGATKRQVTTNGTPDAPYYSPSQADDGTIFVGGGNRIYRMNQAGALLGPPIPTLISDKPPNVYAAGPFNPRVSPDGATVAYWIGLFAGSYDPSCDCYLGSSVEDVVYAPTDGSGPIAFSRFWQTPSWSGNNLLLVFAPDNRQTPQVGVTSLAAQGEVQGWFNDDGEGFEGYWQNLDDGELDRGGHKLALVRGQQAERLSLYAVSDFTTTPVLTCEGSEPSGAFSGPTWSPDGRALAWYENDGVWTSPAPAELTPETCAELAPILFVAGASQPRWGAADVSVASPTPTTTRTTTPTATRTNTATATRTLTAPATATATVPPTPTATGLPTNSPTIPIQTSTPTRTATPSVTANPSSTANATATASSTAVETATMPNCPGDCDDSTTITMDELVRGVDIVLGRRPLQSCSTLDINGDDRATVDELARSVNAALNDCAD
jgi:hypothetical protein